LIENERKLVETRKLVRNCFVNLVAGCRSQECRYLRSAVVRAGYKPT